MRALREYQVQALQAIRSGMNRGLSTMACVMATGTGKSRVFSELAKDFSKILLICNTEELIEQGGRNIIEVIGGGFGLIKAENFNISERVTVASAQTLHRRLDKIPADTFDLVICDECDLFSAVTFKKALEYLQPKLRIGFTATFFRMDNMPLTDLFEEVVYEYPLHKAVKDKWLCKPDAIKVNTNVNLDSVRTTAGELNQGDLSIINTPERNNLIVLKYLNYCKGRQFLAFCVDVQHAIDLCQAFKDEGIACEYVVGDKDLSPERKKLIQQLKDRELMGMTNCMILTAGFDHPNIGAIIMACPTKSRRKYLQQVGRGTRLKDEEYVIEFGQNCIILDVVDVTSRHRLINTDLLDSELDWEDKIFAPQEKIDKVLAHRKERMMQGTIQFDERVELIPLPKVKMWRTKNNDEPATTAQLIGIQKLGYDITSQVYTKNMCIEIIGSQPAFREDYENLKSAGYDLRFGLTRWEASRAYEDLAKRDKKKALKK